MAASQSVTTYHHSNAQKFSSLFKAEPLYEGRLKVILLLQVSTLESGIEVGPTVINLAFFPGPTALLKALHLLISGIFSRPYG
jgi:hypothetical protein